MTVNKAMLRWWAKKALTPSAKEVRLENELAGEREKRYWYLNAFREHTGYYPDDLVALDPDNMRKLVVKDTAPLPMEDVMDILYDKRKNGKYIM